MTDERKQPAPRPTPQDLEKRDGSIGPMTDAKPPSVSDTIKPEPAPKPPDEGHGDSGQD